MGVGSEGDAGRLVEMTEHPNVALLRQAYAALSTGDVDALPAVFTDDVVWHVPGRSPIAGTYLGRDQIRVLLKTIADLSQGTAKREVHEILASDDHGVALVRCSATRNDRSFFTVQVEVFPFRHGKISEVWVHPMDQHAEDEFWSS